jgi:hypothetical protein
MKTRRYLASALSIAAFAATLSAGQLPHTGPGGGGKTRPGTCNWTTRCTPAPVPCGVNPRQAGCRGQQLPPTHRGGGR